MIIKQMRYLVLGILCFVFSTAGKASAEDILLVTHEFRPYSWVDKVGIYKGASVEIADLLFKKAEISKKWRIMPLKRAYGYVKKTPNTCLFPLQRNQEREADFQWVSPIMINRFAFYSSVANDISIRTLEDLNNFKVASYLGSGLKEYLDGFGIKTIEAIKDEVAANMVSLGRADVWATDVFSEPYTSELINKKFNKKFVFFTSIGAMACHQSLSKETINRLQTELSALYRNLEIAKIVRRYER